ncbi:hypothetical protein EI94DRAFT_1612638, partial [Lactarius quietus]
RKDEQCVMDAIEARENVEKNGGDDVDEDGPVKPCPGRRETLKAISMIAQYVSELDNLIARKIESLLGLLIRLIRKDEARSIIDEKHSLDRFFPAVII